MRNVHTTLILLFILFTVNTINAQCINGNCSTGNGTYKWENGDMYAGEWVNGARTGYGRYDWADGSYYVGNFKDNLLSGSGSYYAADGTSMIGQFENNTFQTPAGTTNDDDYDIFDYEDYEDYDDASLSELLDEWDAQDKQDSLARLEAINKASKEDLCAVVSKLIAEFPSGFPSYRGPEQVGLLNFGDSWYSLLMVKNSVEAGITSGFTSSGSFYNVLWEGNATFEQANAKYKAIVDQMNSCSMQCCTMVYDPYEYVSESYSSYSTSWLTFMVNNGYDSEVYTDMVIEVELMSQLLNDGWQITFRMYHLSDMD